MTAPTVRPAVACVAFSSSGNGETIVREAAEFPADPSASEWPVTAIDGDARAVAARVREAASVAVGQYDVVADALTCDDLIDTITTRVIRALGIRTEATTDG